MGQMNASSVAGEDLAIVFEGVTKRYGPVQALADVTLAVERGEMVALLGPNGAGKSTTVDLMLGLRTPTPARCASLGCRPRGPWPMAGLERCCKAAASRTGPP